MKKYIMFLCAFMCLATYAANTQKKVESKENSKVLTTGKKVNSAIDNPSAYYKAQSLKKQKNDSAISSNRKIQINKDAFNSLRKNIYK